MNFNQFAFRNTIRNGHLYLAYFLSTMFSVMVFFTFSVFVFHPQLNDGGLNQNVQVGMKIAAIIIYAFAFFFVMYSMDVFLQSRKKEFGTLMIQGMSPKQLRRMVFIENMVIGVLATIAGSIAGIAFSQVILWIAKFAIGINFGFYLPIQSFVLTIVSFVLLFLVISFLIQFRLPKLNLQELLKANELGKGSIKVSPIKAILGLVMIIAGYVMASMAEKTMIIIVFLPVVFLVIIGTKFLFDQFSVMVIERIRKNPNRFWKKTNMVVFSDLAFRMKDNARSFFLVTIISTVAFSAVGTLFGLGSMLTVGFTDVYYDFGQSNVKQEQIDKTDELLNKYGIDYTMENFAYYNTASNKFINESDYNRQAKLLGRPTVSLKANQVVQLMPTAAGAAGRERQDSATVNGKKYQVQDYLQKTGIPVSLAAFVIPDEITPADSTKTVMTIWKAHNADNETLVKAGYDIGKYEINATAAGYDLIMGFYSPILFVGLFVGIVFFVSAGSFLYFRLYSDMNDDVAKFRMIYKMGLSKKELKKMINQQIGILFFTPIIVSACHGLIALNTMYHAFNASLQLEAVYVVVAFGVIQVLYYLICRHFYFKSVYQKITA